MPDNFDLSWCIFILTLWCAANWMLNMKALQLGLIDIINYRLTQCNGRRQRKKHWLYCLHLVGYWEAFIIHINLGNIRHSQRLYDRKVNSWFVIGYIFPLKGMIIWLTKQLFQRCLVKHCQSVAIFMIFCILVGCFYKSRDEIHF